MALSAVGADTSGLVQAARVSAAARSMVVFFHNVLWLKVDRIPDKVGDDEILR